MATRRKFLGMLGIGAAAGPMAVKEAVESEAMSLSGIGTAAYPPMGMPASSSDPTKEQMRAALRLPAVREQVRSMLFEEHRNVGYIDPDLAVLRSFSLSAKVAFQRQRIVERRLREMAEEYWWKRVNNVFFRALGLQ